MAVKSSPIRADQTTLFYDSPNFWGILYFKHKHFHILLWRIFIHTYVYPTFLFIYVIVINNKKFNFINYVITINIIRFGICIIETKLCRHDASSAQHISRTVGEWRWMRWMWRITLYQNHHVNARTHKLKHILCSPAAQNQQLLYLLLYSTLIYKFWG